MWAVRAILFGAVGRSYRRQGGAKARFFATIDLPEIYNAETRGIAQLPQNASYASCFQHKPRYIHRETAVVTVYPKKYAHGFCFAVLCCGYTLTDFPISIRLTSLALWQSNDCPSASKATLMNMDKYFLWIHYERLHNHNQAKHNKTVCIFLGIYCKLVSIGWRLRRRF